MHVSSKDSDSFWGSIKFATLIVPKHIEVSSRKDVEKH